MMGNIDPRQMKNMMVILKASRKEEAGWEAFCYYPYGRLA